ncbi:GNAT family N-acetyltransferase [Alkalibacillus salilacus]|uniref:Ribosomal protein S18 acetylase RimI-like enzyme n=1 Tax=Alkalibacillus salilacus TaxID=284582 RepID=A0ABT9VG65_9BACI|nr:GNAT family N-acetyltransferase [Alkalibacillus salilacus]MDQ0159970.1 ribosomal protein S18 acetylase RimI-like enzyme [Alkalibacillus salilacus]
MSTLSNRNIKLVDGSPEYVVVEEIGDIQTDGAFEQLLSDLETYTTTKQTQSVSIVLNEQEATKSKFPQKLKTSGFQLVDSQYFYKRNLADLPPHDGNVQFDLKPLKQTSPDLFKRVWQEASADSLNASFVSVDREFEGMKKELGPGYANSCLTVFVNDDPVGVTMPQIEPGTTDEGRLFYFGIIPKYRGQGWGRALHLQSLHYLRKMGAIYYIGGTGEHNKPMQHIFEANGCCILEKKYTYKLKQDMKK